MLRSLTRTNPRRLPGVTCITARTRNRFPSALMSIPVFRRVACQDAISLLVDPCDRSTRPRGTIASMAFARWDPIRDLLAIQQRLDRFAPGPAGWTPPVDLLETAEAYVIVAELPGVDRGDLTI